MAEHGRCQTEVRWVPAATVVASEETALDRETQRKTQPRGGTAQTRGRPTCVRATTMGSLGRQAHAHPRLPRYRGRRSGASRGDDRGKEAGELRCYEIQLPKCQSLTRVWRNALERASNQSLELPHTNKNLWAPANHRNDRSSAPDYAHRGTVRSIAMLAVAMLAVRFQRARARAQPRHAIAQPRWPQPPVQRLAATRCITAGCATAAAATTAPPAPPGRPPASIVFCIFGCRARMACQRPCRRVTAHAAAHPWHLTTTISGVVLPR